MHLITPFLKFAGHQIGSGELFEAQFRVGMDMATQGDHLFFERTDTGQRRQVEHQEILVFIGRFRVSDCYPAILMSWRMPRQSQ